MTNHGSSQFASPSNTGEASAVEHAIFEDPARHYRNSHQRKQNLELYLSSYAPGLDITVILDENSVGAAVVQPGTERDHQTIVKIPSAEIPQPATSLDQDVFIREFQYAEANHELGHILYTPQSVYEEVLDNDEFDPSLGDLLEDILNYCEDAAIETQLRADLGNDDSDGQSYIGIRLELKNRNLIKPQRGHYTEREKTSVTVGDALRLAACDLGKCDAGRLRRLLDEQEALTQVSKDDLEVLWGDAENWEFISDPSWEFDSDRDRELFYDLFPLLVGTLIDVQSISSGRARLRRIEEFLFEINDLLGTEYDADDVEDREDSPFASNQSAHADPNFGDNAESAGGLSGTAQQPGSSETDPGSGSNNPPEPKASDEASGSSPESDSTSESEPDSKTQSLSDPDDTPDSEPESDSSTESSSPVDVDDDNPDSDAGDDAEAQDQDGETTTQQQLSDFAEDEDDAEGSDSAQDNGSEEPQSDEDQHETDETEQTHPDEGASDQPDSGDPQENDDPNTHESETRPSSGTDRSGPVVPSAAGEDEFEPDEDYEAQARQEFSSERFAVDAERQAYDTDIRQFQDGAGDGSGDGSLEFGSVSRTDSPESFPSDRWQSCRRDARAATRLLDTALSQEQQTKKRRGLTTGAPDRTQLHKTRTNDPRLMGRRAKPEEKDYYLLIVLDRSGSMNRYDRIQVAEKCVGTFALGAEELGINVAVMDMYDGEARLVSPFSLPVERSKEHLMSGTTGGGSPLTEAVNIGSGRLSQEANKNPFMLVVTDGKAADRDEFATIVGDAPFPIVGITLLLEQSSGTVPAKFQTQASQFDSHAFAYSEQDLRSTLQRLSYGIAF